MQKRLLLTWGGFGAFLFALWLLIAVLVIRDGGQEKKKDLPFDKSLFEQFQKGHPNGFPDQDEP